VDEHPAFERRPEQAYVGKRVVMPLSAFRDRVPALTQDVSGWLADKGLEASGEPFLRYNIVDMPDRIDVDVAFPVNEQPDADGDLITGILPGGRYGTLTFTGVDNGVASNARLIDWIGAQGERVDSRQTDAGDAFAARIESLLSDPEGEPDPGRWKTRIAIKVRDV
jgi:hypothetical protein